MLYSETAIKVDAEQDADYSSGNTQSVDEFHSDGSIPSCDGWPTGSTDHSTMLALRKKWIVLLLRTNKQTGIQTSCRKVQHRCRFVAIPRNGRT